MSSEHRAFAAKVLAAFEAADLYTDADVKAAGGPSSSYMTGLRKARDEGGELTPPRNDTFGRIDDAANWARGSARRLWNDGSEPESVETVTPDRESDSFSPAWNTRKPDEMSDEEHRRILRETEDYYRWKIQQASQER